VLIEAVFAERIQTLRDEALAAVDAADPGAALIGWLRSVSAYCTSTSGLAAALLHAGRLGGDDPAHGCQATLADAAHPLLDRARADGAIRDDVTIDELLVIVGALAVAVEGRPTEADRLLTLAIEGVSVR
jgi:hypothetical protein